MNSKQGKTEWWKFCIQPAGIEEEERVVVQGGAGSNPGWGGAVFRYELIWKVVVWGVMLVWRWGGLKLIEIWKYFFLIEKCNPLHIYRPVQFQTLILALIDFQNWKKSKKNQNFVFLG